MTPRLALYALTVFCASAALMIMEITAARLLAPYVGVSLYTWTMIIGVMLAGLSLGNWLGGIWVDRGAGEKAAGLTLAFSGVLCLASLLFLTWIAPLLQGYRANLIFASFVYVSALFLLPAVLLGVVTPLLTALALQLDTRTGHVLGRMHALGALGSIAGTFAAGFWLVQYFGTRGVLMGTAAGLLILALPLLWSRRVMVASLFMGLIGVLGLTHLSGGLANPCERESNYFCIRVVDEALPPEFGEVRSLILDHLSHGSNVRDEPTLLVAPYVHAMDELVRQHFDDTSQLRYFFAGGGAYTQPRAVQAATPQAEIHVAEIDPIVTTVARQQLYFDPQGMTIHHRDARPVLAEYPPAYFDVIIGDVFHDVAIPYHLVTREFLDLVKSRLKPGGLYLMNVVDAFPDPRLVKSLLKTAQQEFANVQVWLDQLPDAPQRMTYVISAGDSHQPPTLLVAEAGLQRQWLSINQPLRTSGTPLVELPLLTDNYAPVDRLLASLLFGKLGL
jgi:spermidine synthase